MKNVIKLFSIFSLLLISCDPAHSIEIKNNSESSIRLKIELDEKKLKDKDNKIAYRLSEIMSGDTIVIKLKSKEEFDIYFGIGTWEERGVDSLVSYFKTIEIETLDKNIIYKSVKAKKELFNDKEGFPWKTLIKVNIE